MLASSLLTVALLASADAPALTRDDPGPVGIYGGEPVEACEFPSTASLSSCTATLVHPEVIIYAAHCGTNYSSAFFGDDTSSSGFSKPTEFCNRHPQYNGIGTGTDFAFCKLAEPVTEIPPTPPLMGCEVDVLTEGRDVYIVGFGENDDGGYGRKYKALTTFNYFDNVGDANVGGGGSTVCFGDSGGPTFVKLPEEMGFDGSWRAFGIASYVYTPCGNEGFHAVMHRGIEWIEESSGVDVTPCHDGDGTWNPGPDCKEFPLAIETGSGSWDSACAPGPLTSWSANCGASYAETNDMLPPRVTFMAPADGEFVMANGMGRADVLVEVNAEDDETDIVSVEVMVDGVVVGGADAEPPWVFELTLEEGEYALEATAIDEGDNSGHAGPITITIGREPPNTGDSDGDDEPPEDDGTDEDEDEPDDGDDPRPPVLPANYGAGPVPGCGCTATRPAPALPLLLLVALGFWRRRSL